MLHAASNEHARSRRLYEVNERLFAFPCLAVYQADNQVDHVRQHFYEVSLEYVFKVQEVQERKMFEFVEPVKRSISLKAFQRIVSVMKFRVMNVIRMIFFSCFFLVAAGFSTGTVYVLSPRLRAGQRLQPLQDRSYDQHPKRKSGAEPSKRRNNIPC